MATTESPKYEVQLEHFNAALAGSIKGDGFTDVLSSWVAETLCYSADERPLQDCLAGLLREQGWTCTPAEQATAPDKRARAESIVDTIIASTQSGTGSPGDDEQAQALADRLDVPIGLVWLAADGMTVEQIDALVDWWPAKGGQ